MPKELRQWDAYVELKRLIDDFVTSVPLVQQLAHPAMRMRHWAALVEVTWDAIAAFMPLTHSSRPSPEAARRLTAIARISLPVDTQLAAGTTVLDVGCGHGLLLPFVTEVGLQPPTTAGAMSRRR